MLLAFPQFRIDQIAFFAQVRKHGGIAIHFFVRERNAFLLGPRIIKGRYIGVERNIALMAGSQPGRMSLDHLRGFLF